MGQRRDYAIFLSTILFGAAIGPRQKVAPFVSLGQLDKGSHSHSCMATVVARDEVAVHTGARRLFAITTGECSDLMETFPDRRAQFELGPAHVLGSAKSDLKEWDIAGQPFDLGERSRVGVVMIPAKGFDESVTLADWKSVALAEPLRGESGSKLEVLVAGWNKETREFTKTEATIVPIEQCSPHLPRRGPRKAELYKQHFICVQTSDSLSFSYGAPLYKVTGQDYKLLGIFISSQHGKHRFLNVRADTDTIQGLIEQLKKA